MPRTISRLSSGVALLPLFQKPSEGIRRTLPEPGGGASRCARWHTPYQSSPEAEDMRRDSKEQSKGREPPEPKECHSYSYCLQRAVELCTAYRQTRIKAKPPCGGFCVRYLTLLRGTKLFQIREEGPFLEEDVQVVRRPTKTGL